DWRNYAIAKINTCHMEPWARSVSNDHLRDVRLAFSRLRALGYARIGLAIDQAYDDGCRRRHTAGYLLEEAAVPADRRVPPLLFPYNCPSHEAVGMLCRWIRRHRVDAVITNWQDIDTKLASQGLEVPGDVACASLCLCDTRPALAGVRPSLALVGRRAVSLIATQLKTGEHGVPAFAAATYVQSQWQDGPSAPACAHAEKDLTETFAH
ncbi:MAG: LacI family transcriptional regulator, partial [Verrucomicrobia bacterium]